MEEEAAAKKNNDGDIDWLSSLPDSLLLHILSFLPTKTCVKTINIMSRRYRNLWEHLQVFDFHNDYLRYDDNLVEKFRYFSHFVNFVFATFGNCVSLPIRQILHFLHWHVGRYSHWAPPWGTRSRPHYQQGAPLQVDSYILDLLILFTFDSIIIFTCMLNCYYWNS